MNCAVFGCSNDCYSNRRLQFHKFPSEESIRKAWLAKVPLKGKFKYSLTICSKHFKPSDYYYLSGSSGTKLCLNKNAVPFYDPGQKCQCCNLDNCKKNTKSGTRLKTSDGSTPPPENGGHTFKYITKVMNVYEYVSATFPPSILDPHKLRVRQKTADILEIGINTLNDIIEKYTISLKPQLITKQPSGLDKVDGNNVNIQETKISRHSSEVPMDKANLEDRLDDCGAERIKNSNEQAPSKNGPSHAPGNYLDCFHDFVSQKRYGRRRKKSTDAANQSKNNPVESDERLQVQTIKQEEIEKVLTDNRFEDYQIEGSQDVDPLLDDQQVDQQPERKEKTLCSFCYVEIDRFVYACVQCACRLCGACDARGEHQSHYVLRIPTHRLQNQEEVQKIMAQVREAVESYKLDSDTESETETKPEVSGLVNLPLVEVEFPTTELGFLPNEVEFLPVEMEFPPAEVEFSPAEVDDPPDGMEFLPVKEELDDYFECTETSVTMVIDAIDEGEADDNLNHVKNSTREPATRDKTKEDSELDSEFDDEFNLDERTAFFRKTRDIPHEQDLDESQIQLVNSITDAIDDAVENLEVSTDFVWDADFTKLKSVPESFTGPPPGPVNDYNTPLEAFLSIWDRIIMELIVEETNKYARQTIAHLQENNSLKTSSRLHRWTETCVNEMYVFFGIHILMGLVPRKSQHEFWKTTGYLEMPQFRALMPYNRFILLWKFLHFVDNSDPNFNLKPNEGAIPAKLKEIAPIIQYLNSKFSSLYNLYPDIAIDESLTLFEGQLSWVHAIRTKSARFGIKSYELCESSTGYLCKFDIYTEKNSEPDVLAQSADLAGKTAQVVLELLKGLENRGHCVAMDNFYNCPVLARYLKRSGFDCIGTLRPNRKHVPAEIAEAPKNLAKGTVIARHSGDVSCIAWKDTTMVCMISTYHNADTCMVWKAGKEISKPIVVRDYNKAMGGVDLKEQTLSMYLVKRKRFERWYATMFKRLLNCSVLNAFVMLTGSLKRRNLPVLTHRDFREQLANSLVSKHSTVQIISRPVGEITRLKRNIVHVPKLMGVKNRAMCLICYRNGIVKKVQLKCETCDEFLCPEECWTDWHCLRNLPGRDIKVRKGARRK